MKKILLVLLLGLVALASVVSVRAARYGLPREAVKPAPVVAVDAGAAARLAGAIRIPTVSRGEGAAPDSAAFAALHEHLRAQFPRVHAALAREAVAGHSLLYTWTGSEPSLPPLLLVAHMDVVPVEPGTEAAWTHPPFAGAVGGGHVWGRGALDDKASVVGILEAVEMLLGEGFRPRRTVLLAFGHDEEVGGRGAQAIAALLKARGVRPEMVLDEGGAVTVGLVPGVRPDVALVGIAEKGYVSVELTAGARGGHSSMPPARGAIGRVARAVARLEEEPMPARLDGVGTALFPHVGQDLPFGQRAAFANLWLTRPLVARVLAGAPSTNAAIRTTAAPTIFQAGTKDNVLPAQARAVVNFRILPGDSVAGVLAHVRRVVDDPQVRVRAAAELVSPPSPVSPIDGEPFRMLSRAVRQARPGTVVAPYLVVGATDARHYAALSPHVFRFLPVRMTGEDLDRMHGTDERISVRDYEDAVRFYRLLVVGVTSR